jgi:hypothetical protein
LNASPFIARTSLICGIVVAAVGTGVGAGVGGGVAVGVAVGDGEGAGVGLAVAVAGGDVEGGAVTGEASDGEAAIVGVGAVAGDEHAHASAKPVASASRRAPMTVTLSTYRGHLRYEGRFERASMAGNDAISSVMRASLSSIDDARDVPHVGSFVVRETPGVLEYRPFPWASGASHRRAP